MPLGTGQRLTKFPAELTSVSDLRRYLSGIDGAFLYYGFPRYRDDAHELYDSYVIAVVPEMGVLIVGAEDTTRDRDAVNVSIERLDQFTSMLVSKFLTSKALRQRRMLLSFPVVQALYAPNLTSPGAVDGDDFYIVGSPATLTSILDERSGDRLSDDVLANILATVDGSRVIPRPKARRFDPSKEARRGRVVEQLESRLATFDRHQREGLVTELGGPQRLRGLAGSGKTIVLAMKAALTHLDNPDATIVYTFYTKSLYQYIRRLITRFYRDHDDRDPNWDKLRILHGWGGRATSGVYSWVCDEVGEASMTYPVAAQAAPFGVEPFSFACTKLLERGTLPKLCDYLFIDEGQDFPPSFLQVCDQITNESRWIWAYDELQTIFQPRAPTAHEVWGTTKDGTSRVEFERDVVLQRCYRNPREVLVCAHALGFGLYGTRITQLLTQKEHWEELGYRVISGDFTEGSEITIERPAENSLPEMPDLNAVQSIVSARDFQSIGEELDHVAEQIELQISDGLRADDIAVVCVDDRNARDYFRGIESRLARRGINAHNMHAAIGNPDYQVEDAVTLATVHRAKGNESFSVFVVGSDAVFQNPDPRRRNMLFTAITRAKAWVQISGVGEFAKVACVEVTAAMNQFPLLVFKYPSDATLEVMARDLQRASSRVSSGALLDSLTEEELEAELARRRARASKKGHR